MQPEDLVAIIRASGSNASFSGLLPMKASALMRE